MTALLASCSTTYAPIVNGQKGLFDAHDSEAEQLARDLAEGWMQEVGNGALDGVEDFFIPRVDFDDLGMAHVRVQQTVDGLPVFGGEAIVHLLPDGTTATFTDDLSRQIRVNHSIDLTEQDATDAALYFWKGGVSNVETDLLVLRHTDGDHVAYRVQITDDESPYPARPVLFIDASTGDEVWRYDNLQTAKNRSTYSANNGSSLPGTLRRSEGSADIGDLPVDSAHNYAGITYDYYWNVQGRDSYDGVGGTLKSTAHYSTNYGNAYWDTGRSQMVYGDGDSFFKPLSQALDVVAHELTHAVTDRTAGLIYAGESGGLNEATSDIMAATVESFSRGGIEDSKTWMVGEDIAKAPLGDALRYMDVPTNDGVSIDNYSNYNSSVDVHYSSGIANKAFYTMVTDPSLDIAGAGSIWYRALTLYMTSGTTFSAARTATINAATDLYGAGSAQVTAVDSAWAAVGVTPPLTYTVFDTKSSLSASTNTQTQYQFVTPAGATSLQFKITGGTGDADLYVRFGSAPTLTSYDCRPYLNGNSETCTVTPAQSGTYHVMLNAYSTYSGVTLTASSAGGGAPPPPPPAEVCDDGIDNDSDGAVDCADSGCTADPSCTAACANGTYTGTLSSTNTSDEYQYTASASGLFEASLTGDAGTDFDLYLEYLSGNRWRTRASSLGSTSTEYVNYNEGSVVLHRWKVKRWSGTGNYTLCVNH